MSQHGSSYSDVLPDGVAITKELKSYQCPTTVWVQPGFGSPTDGISVWYSANGGATFKLWGAGEVFAYTDTVFDSPITHLKFQRTSGTGTNSTFGWN